MQSKPALLYGIPLLLLMSGCYLDRTALGPIPGARPNAYACTCTCDSPPGSVEVALASSDADAEELLSSGVVNLDSTDLELVEEAGPQLVGLRFAGLGIPRGATILSARLQFTADQASSGAAVLQLNAEASAAAAPFSATMNNLSLRLPTSASVVWTPSGWVEGTRGPDQQTPDLSAILQELVDQPAWSPESPMVLLVSGAGHRVAVSWDGEPTQSARLTVTFQTAATEVAINACVPSEINPNHETEGDLILTRDEVVADCSGRVQQTLSGLSAACGYPSACSCAVDLEETERPTQFVEACNDPCEGEVVDAACTNFDPENLMLTATHAEGDAPVCITSSPLSAGIFGQQSACAVTGVGTIVAEGETLSSAASGVIEFRGGPCPGQSCEVGMRYQVGLEPITAGNIFSSRTFEDLRGAGHSLSGLDAVLGVDGTGVFAPGSTQNSARGRSGSDMMGYAGSNGDPIAFSLTGGASPACSLNGAMVGGVDPEVRRCEAAGPSANQFCSVDADCVDDVACTDEVCNCVQVESSDVTLSLALSGLLVNQPPKTNAGANQTVECSEPGAARVTLSAATSDPDGNVVQVRWTAGSRVGTEVAQTSTAWIRQAVGTTTYVNRVIDARGQSDEDFTIVQVVDTTAPEIACNAPATITPPQPPLTFTSTASDVCDATVSTEIISADCYRVNGSGKIIDTTHACRPETAGGAITVVRSVGVGNHIRWTVRATDVHGNASERTCEVEVVRPGN